MAFTWRLSTLVRLGKIAADPKCRLFSLSSMQCGRIVPFKLSDIGEGIRDVTVKEWFVKPGDRVAQFDNICEVQSDKASVTITSRYDGLIKTIHYEVDSVALIGDALVDIELDHDGEQSNPDQIEEKAETTKKTSEESTKHDYEESFDKVLATPAVRRIAMENNINLKEVVGTGKAGRVLKEDLLAHLDRLSKSTAKEDIKEKRKTAEIVGQVVPLKGYAKHMWKTMTKSLSIPHFVYSDECNLNKLVAYRNQVKDSLKKDGVSLTFMPFFIKAVSRTLDQLPQLNAWLDEENQTIRILENHNIGIAMDTPEGLVVPNIKNVQNLSIVEIARELNRLQALGRKSSIPFADLSDTTFSLSNIGVIGGTYTKPVILPPQIVIGAVGRTQRVPRFDEKNNVIAADILSVSWAADHRVVDGVTMAKFSNQWKYYVENPAHLLLGA